MPDRQDVVRQNVRDLIDYRGLKIKGVAHEAGLAPGTLYGFLSGQQNAGELVLNKLAKALSIHVEHLFDVSMMKRIRGGQTTTPPPPEGIEVIERRLSRMTQAQRDHYLRMFTAMLEAGEQGGEYDSAGDGN